MVLVAHLRMAGFFGARWRIGRDGIASPLRRCSWPSSSPRAPVGAFRQRHHLPRLHARRHRGAAAHRRSPGALPLGVATGSNIGSVATITGNPQNMLIGTMSRMSYLEFARHLAPVALIGLALDALVLMLIFRRELAAGHGPAPHVHDVRVHSRCSSRRSSWPRRMFAAFLAGYDSALVAAAGAAALLVTRRVKPERVYRAGGLGSARALRRPLRRRRRRAPRRIERSACSPLLRPTRASIPSAGLSLVTAAPVEPDQQRADGDALHALGAVVSRSAHRVADARDVEHARRESHARRIDREPDRRCRARGRKASS